MRKFFALLLLFSVFFSFSALAEEVPLLYIHPSLGYSFEMPGDWIFADESKMPDEKNLQDFALTEEEEKAIAEAGMAVFLAPDGYRLTITREFLPLPLTAEQFMSMMMSHKLTEMEAAVDGISFPDHPSVYYTEDDRAFCHLTALYPVENEKHTLTRYFLPEGDAMYVLSFVAPLDLSEEDAEDLAYDYKWLTRALLDTFFPNF